MHLQNNLNIYKILTMVYYRAKALLDFYLLFDNFYLDRLFLSKGHGQYYLFENMNDLICFSFKMSPQKKKKNESSFNLSKWKTSSISHVEIKHYLVFFPACNTVIEHFKKWVFCIRTVLDLHKNCKDSRVFTPFPLLLAYISMVFLLQLMSQYWFIIVKSIFYSDFLSFCQISFYWSSISSRIPCSL